MEYFEKDGGVVLRGLKSFSLSETLDCGQCFRAYELDASKYYTIAHGRLLTITGTGDSFIFSPATAAEFESVWAPYFDIYTDYDAIKETLSANDVVMRDAVEYAPGVRVLRQEFFECLIAYIISQNNRIPMIKQVVKNLSQAFGSPVGEVGGEICYSFPTLNVLSRASLSELRACRTGFRDKYIKDACRKLQDGTVDVSSFEDKTVGEIRESLMKINGVGTKVADCVILFSLGRFNCFPTDVWIKRIMEHFYFGGQAVSIKEIHALAERKFGQYAGYAQEYLFYYARQFQIGKPGKTAKEASC